MIVSNSCRCAKCSRLLSYEERVRITESEFIADTQCSGSRGKTICHFSLCRSCYEDYNKLIEEFLK